MTVTTDLTQKLHDFFGFDTFKGEQEIIIRSILDGNHTFVIMPTGAGKSLCYQLPALISEGTALVISPLIALMKNQVDSLRGYSSNDGVAHFLNSSLNRTQVKKVKKDVEQGITKLLYVAPETLTKEDSIDFLSSINISFVAVDEAHCISEWGHDFRPEYRRIRDMIDAIEPSTPIIALTATATPKVKADIIKNLRMNNDYVFTTSFNRGNLYYEIRPKTKKEQTFKQIIKIAREAKGQSGIVYVQSRKATEEIAKMLNINGIKAAPYHAGLDQKLRAKTQDAFLMEEIDVICATIAFGMGIDKPDIRFVIHYDIPKSIENYYQETGRAGRDGLEGKCISFYSHKDVLRVEKFMRDKPAAEREMGHQLLNEIIAFAETSSCRRKFLLHYFGEEFEAEDCNKNCDSCRYPKEKVEAKDDLQLALKAVSVLKEKYRIKSLVDFVLGNKTKEMIDYRHDRLEEFGKGEEKESHYWNSVFRQALLYNFVVKGIENYGIIYLTEKGKEFIENPTSFKMPVNRNYDDMTDDDLVSHIGGGVTALDDVLFGLLKDLRRDLAHDKKIPPYVIFQDPSLADMSTYYPISLDDMVKISGVSKGKAMKYAKPFLKLIENYVEENEIERPDDLIMKTAADKSRIKIKIIQAIDKKIPFEDIAESNKISIDELYDELYRIVQSGTKVSIDYYIDDILDEYAKEDIFDYFMDAETDDADIALIELKDEDYTIEEIRLMRLKFISEVAN